MLLPWQTLTHFPPTRPLSLGWEGQVASPPSASLVSTVSCWGGQLSAPGLRAQVRGTRGRSWLVACSPWQVRTWDQPRPLGCSESYFLPASLEIFEIVIGAFAVQNDNIPLGSCAFASHIQILFMSLPLPPSLPFCKRPTSPFSVVLYLHFEFLVEDKLFCLSLCLI